jgi:outer membrane cobalamin receptor
MLALVVLGLGAAESAESAGPAESVESAESAKSAAGSPELPAPRDSIPNYVLDPVVIEGEAWGLPGEGAPVAASVVTSAVLARCGVLRLADALGGVPGVRVARFGAPGSFAAVSVRGTRSDQVLVLVDGRRLTTAQGGGVDLGAVDVATLERIEVVRGGASALYGADALGGVINLVTRPLSGGAGGTALRLEGGSFGTIAGALRHERTAGTSGRLWLKGHGLRTAGDYRYRDRGSETERRNAGARASGTSAGLLFPVAPSARFTLDGGIEASDQEVPGTVEFPTPHAHRDDRRASAAAELILLNRPAGATRMVVEAHQHRQRRSYRDPDYGIADRHVNSSTGIELKLDRSLAPEHAEDLESPATRRLLTSGFELQRDALTSTTDGDRERRSAGLYLRGQLAGGPLAGGKLLLAPAVRLDTQNDLPPLLSSRLALGVDLPAGYNLRLSAGRSYHPPSFDDLFFPDTGGALGNPDLEPERAFEVELGLGRAFGQRATLATHGFRQEIDDLIQWAPGPDGRWRPHNVGKAILRGIELEGRTAVRVLGLAGDADLALSLDLLDARNRTGEPNVDGRRLPYRPAITGRFELAAPLSERLRLIAAWQGVGRSFVTPSNTKSVPGHGLIDLTAELVLTGRLLGSVAALNLADIQAADVRDYPLPGREWRAALRWNAPELP